MESTPSTFEECQSVAPPLESDYDRHVFITHCEADREEAVFIYKALTARKFICGLASKDFTGGGLIYYQIIEAIGKSKKILALLSRNALESYWCTLELSLTLDRTTRDDRVAIIPVLVNLQEKDIPDVLTQLQCIHWHKEDHTIEAICQVLKGPDVLMENLLPVGNVGRGLAWSYFYSFLNIIFKDLQEARIKFLETRNIDEQSFSRKVYLLLPESCVCPKKLTDQDSDIMFVDSLRPEPLSVIRAGKPREYNNSVYKMATNNKEYYFVGEYCSVIGPMNHMEKGTIARLTSDEKYRQVHTFYFTLDDILNHAFPGLYRIVRYNDKDEKKMSDQLLAFLEDDLKQTPNVSDVMYSIGLAVQDLSMDTIDGQEAAQGELQDLNNSISLCNSKSEACFKNDVFIMYGDGPKDTKLAIDIAKFLESKKLICEVKDRDLTPGGHMMNDMYQLTKRSKRIILILSDEMSDNILGIFYMLRVPEGDKLHESVPPIPVLREPKQKQKEIDEFTKTMTYIDTKDEDFWERLHRAVIAEVKVPLLPAGEIAEGFVWSYFYGYLQMVLPGLKERIGTLDKYDQIRNRVSHKMYLFLPESGKMLDRVNELPGVEDHEQIKWEQDVAGNVKRSYNSVMYKVKSCNTGQDWYFVGEYITPLVVLKDMEAGLVAGMSSDARLKQVSRLYSRLQDILSHEHAQDIIGRLRLFLYDDSEGFNSAEVCRDIIGAVDKDVKELAQEAKLGSCGDRSILYDISCIPSQ